MTNKYLIPLLVVALTIITLLSQSTTAKILFTGRKYYVGGDFTKAYQEDKSTLDSKYLAVFNGEKWELPGGLEPNGPVRVVFKDACQNLWIGGEFSKVGDTKTGPLAVMYRDSNTFDPVGASADWSDKAEVRDLHVDCLNVPKGGICTKKQCDIYVGGIFTKAGTGVESTNVAWWDAGNDKWGALAGLPSKGKVNAVRYFSNIKTLYVGGDFEGYAKMTKRDTVHWEDLGEAITDVVHTMYSDPALTTLTNNHLYLGGEFTKPYMKAARYLTKDKVFESLAPKDKDIPGSVRAIGLSEDYVYIAGDFVLTDDKKYVLRTKKSDGNYWEVPSGAKIPVDSRINAIFVCSKSDANCKDGDAFVAGENKRKSDLELLPIDKGYRGNGYFEEKGGDWTQFGFGVNGNIDGINTAFSGSRSLMLGYGSMFLSGVVSLVVFATLAL